jgi:hypothetical protein
MRLPCLYEQVMHWGVYTTLFKEQPLVNAQLWHVY